MNRWDTEGIPHKGWHEVEEADLGRDPSQHATCQMCGNKHVRYVHRMTHPDGMTLNVGGQCAAKMQKEYIETILDQSGATIPWLAGEVPVEGADGVGAGNLNGAVAANFGARAPRLRG